MLILPFILKESTTDIHFLVYKNLKMLSGDEYRRIASERGISILDKGYNTDFQKEIEQTGLQQNHHIAFYGGSSESSYRVSLGFMDRQGVILNEDMKNFTSNMNMNQKMFDGFLNCELGMFGSIQKNHNLVDYQKTFYSAATFNPTYPNHKDPVTNSWDGITTASQITNPLAWMEVQDDDATSHISTHARLTFNLLEGLKLNLFGANSHGTLAFSLSSTITFLRASGPGDTLFAEARERYIGRSTGCYQVDITNQDGELIATFESSVFRKDQKVPFEVQE